MPSFFTIGHSTRSIAEFAGLLQAAGVDTVVDIRTVPRSRTNPQFNADVLPQALAPYGIAYRHLGALGGLRGRRRNAPPSANGWWENESFRNYADYTASAAFRGGLDALRSLGQERHCALMCAEAVWWRCHRRIVADYLLSAGDEVFHILGPGHIEPARMTPAARRLTGGTLIYPGDETGAPEDR